MITTTTEIKHFQNRLEVLDAIDIDLEIILVEEFAQGLPTDLEAPN